MTEGAVDDDAREDEDHRQDPGQVGDVLLWRESGVMVVNDRRKVNDDVAQERQRHQCQADAHQQGKPIDLVPDGARGLYH
jgi:hypothetical protein